MVCMHESSANSDFTCYHALRAREDNEDTMNFGRELNQDENRDDVCLLHTSLVLLDLEMPERERNQAPFGVGTAEAVTRLQRTCGLEPSGIVDPATSAAIAKALEGKRYTVTGTVRSPDRAGVGGLRVVIANRQTHGGVSLAETHTDAVGRYEAHCSARRLAECHKTRPDLQTSSMTPGVWHADEHGTVTGTSTASSPAGGYEFHSIIFGPIFGDRRTPTPSR